MSADRYASSDPLPADFADALAAARGRLGPLGHRIVFFNTTDSTNTVALSLAGGDDAEGIVVMADSQTAGRGRQGRAWHSPPGGGLYVSIILAPSRARVDRERATGLLTLGAGVALTEAVEAVTGLRPEIKWPNDLLIGRRKLAGILAESAAGDLARVVVGYGINVQARALPAAVESIATSLESELGREIDRAALCVETMAAMARRYHDLMDGQFDAILDAWRTYSPRSRGAHVTWNTASGVEAGVTEGIDDRGALLVRVGGPRAGRIERIVGGELTWR